MIIVEIAAKLVSVSVFKLILLDVDNFYIFCRDN